MPNNTLVLNNLSYILAENNQEPEKALEFARRAYESQPNNPNFLDTYSFALFKNGKFAEAAEFIQAALQQYEGGRISAPADVYEHLGMIKEALESNEQALAAYRQALKAGGDNISDMQRERIDSAIKRLSADLNQ